MSGEPSAHNHPLKLTLPWNAVVPDGYAVVAVDESTCLMIVCPVTPPQLEVK
jgi:hypothetical protein